MHLQILVIVAMAALGAAASAQEESQSHCEKSCGSVNITYPFGTGEGCYYSPEFNVTCNRSSSDPTLLLGSSNIVISNIGISTSELEIKALVADDCYNSSGFVRRKRTRLQLGSMRISTKNRFVAIGCDTHAYFIGARGNQNGSDGTGCISRCGSNSLITDGSCSGVGCCEIAVPEGMRSVRIRLSSYDNHTNITDFNPCSYGFFAEEGKFHFSANNLHDFQSVTRMPMLLDWEIGNLTCDVARKDVQKFLCKNNSTCDPNYTGPGYRCVCLDGYEGNPYVGCKGKCCCMFSFLAA